MQLSELKEKGAELHATSLVRITPKSSWELEALLLHDPQDKRFFDTTVAPPPSMFTFSLLSLCMLLCYLPPLKATELSSPPLSHTPIPTHTQTHNPGYFQSKYPSTTLPKDVPSRERGD